LAAGIVASRELDARRDGEIDRQVELAVIEPPARVLELIGERPVSGVRLAQQWERLAESIERHRLEYNIDIERDGVFGPGVSRIPATERHRYERSRDELAAQVDRFRSERDMPDDPLLREILANTSERSVGVEREL
jgi:hypothetical protein